MAKISKKDVNKSSKLPHPKGRRAAQMSKTIIKAAARKKSKLVHQMNLNLTGEKLLWFKEHLDPCQEYTPQLTIKLIERFDEELEQIRLKHSIGNRKKRQHASREDIIIMTKQNEKNEFFTCGIEMPNVLDPEQLNLLRNWSGELRYLQNFKLVRFTKSQLLAHSRTFNFKK